MYFGQRILQGELAFVKEFDDKSILLSALFALPAALKTIKAWTLISIVCATFACRSIYISLRVYLRELLKDHNQLIKPLSLFASAIYLFTLSSAPDGLNHINNVASSLLVLILSPLLKSYNQDKINPFSTLAYCLLGAIAISIRPYLILPISLISIWISARKLIIYQNYTSIRDTFGEVSRIIGYIFTWNLLLAIFLTVLNILPYFLMDSFSSFSSGFRINSIEYIAESPFKVFISQLLTSHKALLLCFILVANSLVAISIFFRMNTKSTVYKSFPLPKKISQISLIDITFFSIIFPASLELLILKRHFFDHYFSLFCPFTCISSAIIIAFLINSPRQYLDFKSSFINNRLLALFLIALFGLGIASSFSTPKNQLVSDMKRYILHSKISNDFSEIQTLVDSRNPRYSFLVTEDNLPHWVLNESRHGFPHASVFVRITRGKSDLENVFPKDILEKATFLFPMKENLCDSLLLRAPEITFVGRGSLEDKCFQKYPNTFKLLSGNYGRYIAYLRKG